MGLSVKSQLIEQELKGKIAKLVASAAFPDVKLQIWPPLI